MVQLSLIIPTLNEASNIDGLIAAIQRSMSSPELIDLNYEILVVDDNSEDETVPTALAWGESLPVRVIERRGKRDLSASVLEGVDRALGKWIVVMDADGSHPPSALPELVKPLLNNTADLVVGSRHVMGGATVNWPWYRHVTSRLATWMAWPFTEVKDPMSGFFATSKEIIQCLPRSAAGYKILLELLVQGGDQIRIQEIPIQFEDRQHGQSKLTHAQQIIYLKRLMNLGGGRVSKTTAQRFLGVGLIGMVIDLSLFLLLAHWHAGLATAHMASFSVATLFNFSLNHRWSFRGSAHTQDSILKRYARFMVIAIFALLLRGGVLIFLIDSLNWPAWLAILPAIGATTIVNYLGSAFFVFASTESGVIPRVRWHLAALALFVYVFVLRILYLPHLPLLPDEMYYWVYAQHLDLSYLDHPPLVAWLMGASTALMGDHTFAVRAWLLPIVLLGAIFFYRYGETMGGRTVGLLSMLALVSLPFFFLSGLVLTPDAPMIVAWAASLFYLKRLLVDQQSRAFIGLGLAMGLGLLAKYSIALLALGGLVFMALDTQARRWLFKPPLYRAIAIATLIFSPVLWWNSQNGWASFGFQFTRRLAENPDFTSHLVVVYALLLLSPVFATAAFYLFFQRLKRRSEMDRKTLFMLVMTLVPLSVFFMYGLFSVTKFHWTLPAWIALIPLVMQFLMAPYLPNAPRLSAVQHVLARSWAPSLLVLVISYGLLLHYITLGLPGVTRSDWNTAYLSWPELTRETEELAQSIEAETGIYPIVAATDKWGVSAALSYYGGKDLSGNVTAQNILGMSGSMWEFWFDDEQPTTRPILLVHHKAELIEEEWIEDALIEVGPLQSKTLTFNDKPPATLYYRKAMGFRREQVRTPESRPPLP